MIINLRRSWLIDKVILSLFAANWALSVVLHILQAGLAKSQMEAFVIYVSSLLAIAHYTLALVCLLLYLLLLFLNLGRLKTYLFATHQIEVFLIFVLYGQLHLLFLPVPVSLQSLLHFLLLLLHFLLIILSILPHEFLSFNPLFLLTLFTLLLHLRNTVILRLIGRRIAGDGHSPCDPARRNIPWHGRIFGVFGCWLI